MDDEFSTKWHPRTLNEAFPGTPEYACSIEIHNGSKLDIFIMRLAIVIAVCALVYILLD